MPFALQIPMVADLPVGENYQDHPIMAVNVFFEHPENVKTLDMSELGWRTTQLKYFLAGKGKL